MNVQDRAWENGVGEWMAWDMGEQYVEAWMVYIHAYGLLYHRPSSIPVIYPPTNSPTIGAPFLSPLTGPSIAARNQIQI